MMIIPEYDMHVHTVLCGHAHESATVERLAAHADILGMKLLCFSEHVHGPESFKHLEFIRKAIDALQPVCRCRLVLGAEVDADSDHSDGRLVVPPPEYVEFVIGSVHFLPETQLLPPWDQVPPEMSPEKIFQNWANTFMGLTFNRRVDMIGHPGALIFNAVGPEYHSRILSVMRDAAKISAIRGQAWDFNNLIFAKLKEPVRSNYWQVMQLAIDEGVRVLYGSDTHNIASLGGYPDIELAMPHLHGLTLAELLRLPDWLARRFNIVPKP